MAVLLAPDTPTLAVLEELHVSATPVMLLPAVSMTVALAERVVPSGTAKSVLVLPFNVKEIDRTGQIVTGVAMLLAEPRLAAMVAVPGAVVVACT